MKRTVLLVVAAALAVALAGWAWASWRGPALPGYEVQQRPLVQTVVATGRVVASSRAQVGSAITAVVAERRVQEGDRVQPGDVLAVLRADDLEAALREAEASLARLQQSTRPQAQASLREAEARLAQARRETTRRRELADRQLVARETLEQAVQAETAARAAAEQARLAARALGTGNPEEAAARARVARARAQLDQALVRAEVAGTVLVRNVEPGDLVQPGRVLFEIARTGATEVLVPVDEKNLGVLRVGQPAQCVADAYQAQPFPARIAFIAPGVDPQRGSVDIRLAVDPVPEFVRQDMTVSVNVETGRRDAALVVPNDALGAVAGDRAEVWRVKDGRAGRTPVRLGLRGLTLTEVVDGLAPGDRVLADAGAGLQDGDRVRVDLDPLPAATAAASRNELPVSLD